jgi:5-methyltetrahydropteroyltriglutamate--homocysteine methyltransferase
LIGINTMLFASASALSAAFITKVRFGKPDASLTANGWVGGLVASSASCAFVSPAEALVIGSISGTVVTFSVEWFELRMEVDDPGGSVSVHAVGGLWGILALGFFGQFQRPVLNVTDNSLPAAVSGIVSGQWLAQLIGVATLLGFVLPLTYCVNRLLNRFYPFRVSIEGEELRTAPLKDARAKREKGEITAEDLRKAEDLEIEKVVHKQASIGLKLATDGEFRRSWWHFDFLAKLTGCELFHPDTGIQFAGVQTRHDAVRVIGKLDFPDNHPMLDHFRFLKKHCDTAHVTAKMTIPSPAVLHFRGGRKSISKQVYPNIELFFEDIAKTYRKAVRAFYDAGCRYLQLDDTVWAYLCSQDELNKVRARGEDADNLQEIYARVINYAIAERPADMTITTHVCRGNFRSTWISSGGYEPVAETMLAGTNYDGYFLEYDSDRAGGFEPLRYLPKGNKVVVVGVITSKTGQLENKDDIKRRLEEASKFVPLDQLAVSPQCGFASTEEGNILTEEEQWAKLRLAVDVAKEVWGK